MEKLVRKFVTPHDDGGSWIPYAAQRAAESVKNGSDVILSTSPPVSTHLAAMWVRMHYPIKWIADFRDPLFGSAFRPNSSRRLDSLLEKRIFHYADLVIANTDALQKTWSDRYPQYSKKIRLLWNGFDPEELVLAQTIPVREHRILTHAGNIYPPRHPGQLLSSVRRLIEQHRIPANSLKIRFIGKFIVHDLPGARNDFEFLAKAGYVESSNDFLPRQQALEAIATSDFLMLLDVCGDGPGLQVPSKLFDYVRIGRPVLSFTTPNSPVERILCGSAVQYRCVYDTDPPNATDAKILEFLQLTSEPTQPSEWFRGQFDGSEQVQHLARWIDTLFARSGDVPC